jgi:hypothetical protein
MIDFVGLPGRQGRRGGEGLERGDKGATTRKTAPIVDATYIRPTKLDLHISIVRQNQYKSMLEAHT